MVDLSNKTVLFWDSSAGYTHLAQAVVGEFGRVLYHVPWDKAFPTIRDYIPGTGLPDIERVDDFFDALERTDLVVFPDVGNGGLQEYLKRQGMPVFGSGAAGRLERDRWYLKSCCKRYELDCADAMPMTGLDNLRELLGNTEDEVYVKLSTFRGEGETFKHQNAADTARRLNEWALQMEPYQSNVDFVVEAPIQGKPCVEIGADLIVNVTGVIPQQNLYGVEVKDTCYAGCVGKLPARLQRTVDRLAPILERYNYRGAMCTETRETPDGSYLIDFTARFGNPPSPLMRFMIDNLGELLWEAAHGRIVEPEWTAPIGVQIILKSPYIEKNPLRVTSDRWDRTVLFGHCSYDGNDYAVSPAEIPECGAACGMGHTLEQAMSEACEVVEGIRARDLEYNLGALQELTDAIQTAQELGIEWG